MDHFGGLDVSVKETSICIVDDTGRIVKEVKVASEPAALLKVLGNPTYRFKRIGLEAGPLSQWLFSALAEAELPVICVETRHMQAVLKAQINKTDREHVRRNRHVGVAAARLAGLNLQIGSLAVIDLELGSVRQIEAERQLDENNRYAGVGRHTDVDQHDQLAGLRQHSRLLDHTFERCGAAGASASRDPAGSRRRVCGRGFGR